MVAQKVSSAVVGVDAAEAVEKIGSGDVSGEAETGAVFEMAVGDEKSAAIEVPHGALGNFGNFFGGSFGFAGAVLDARLQRERRRYCKERQQHAAENRNGPQGNLSELGHHGF